MSKGKDRYKVLFENSGANVIICDGKFKEVNQEFTDLTGYSESELVGMESLNVVPKSEREEVRNKAIKMLEGERAEPYEHRVQTKEGEVKWVVEKVSSFQFENENCILTSFIDITDRKRSEEAENFLKELMRGRIRKNLGLVAKNLQRISELNISDKEERYLKNAADHLVDMKSIIDEQLDEVEEARSMKEEDKVLNLMYRTFGFVHWSDSELEGDIMEVYKELGGDKETLMEIEHLASKNRIIMEDIGSKLSDFSLEDYLSGFKVKSSVSGRRSGKNLFTNLIERESRSLKYLYSLRSALDPETVSKAWTSDDTSTFFSLFNELVENKKKNFSRLRMIADRHGFGKNEDFNGLNSDVF
ncbi:MAG: PAS domain S-box protein [Candidatus Hadarchaeia archaeon]